jgi:hypothetical protein
MSTPIKRLSPREKAAAHPKSVKLAIAAFCYHQCNGEDAVNSHITKLEIKNCQELNCALYPHRGWQEITGGNVKTQKPTETP